MVMAMERMRRREEEKEREKSRKSRVTTTREGSCLVLVGLVLRQWSGGDREPYRKGNFTTIILH
jgi:hypothetical protein